jgi:hypothetical protein
MPDKRSTFDAQSQSWSYRRSNGFLLDAVDELTTAPEPWASTTLVTGWRCYPTTGHG